MSALMTAPAPAPITPPLPNVPKGFEYVGGRLREKNVSHLSSFVAGRVFRHLDRFVDRHDLGWVSPADTSFRCFPWEPARLRRPDASFHRRDRLTPEQISTDGQCRVAPDLVVEVNSPHDNAGEVERKRLDWLRADAQLVWVVDPVARTVHAYRADGTVALFGPDDALTVEPVLPEFRLPIPELFADLPVLPPLAGAEIVE